MKAENTVYIFFCVQLTHLIIFNLSVQRLSCTKIGTTKVLFILYKKIVHIIFSYIIKNVILPFQ